MTDDFHTLTPWAHAIVALLAGVGMLLIIPLGLALIPAPGAGAAILRRWWVAVALPAAISLWLPRGLLTATLATPYLCAAAILLTDAVLNFRVRARYSPYDELSPDLAVAGPGAAAGSDQSRLGDGGGGDSGVRKSWAFDVACLTALCGPAIAGSALVAERSGDRLFGFDLDTLTLTVAHFHYAGFAAALVAALLLDRNPTPAATIAAWCVPAGTLIVLLGYFTGDEVELAGAAVLTLGMWLAGWITYRESQDPAFDPATRKLLATSAVTLIVTMLLALDWALGEVTGLPHLPLSWMAATHGLANALGFALCSLLAWRRVHRPAAGPALEPAFNSMDPTAT